MQNDQVLEQQEQEDIPETEQVEFAAPDLVEVQVEEEHNE
jgi:hypothetical protein